jgi:hypothetical protein
MEPLKNQDEVLVYLAAQGRSPKEIADILGLTAETVRLKLNHERIQFEVKHLRYKLFGKDHKKRFSDILPYAIDATEAILKNPSAKDRTRFAAAQEIMDRALGKPKQTVEHEGSLIRALIEKLDQNGQNEKAQSIDSEVVPELSAGVSTNPNEISRPDTSKNPNLQTDSIDQWAEENF